MSDRRRLLMKALPLLFVALLAVAWLAPDPPFAAFGTRGDAADRVGAALDSLPAAPIVGIGFDPDAGTYAEVRPAVRALLDELLARDATLVFVNLTAEGRALLVGELARLGTAGTDADAIVDVGFVPGAEAALVALSRSIPRPAGGSAADDELLAELEATGLDAADLLVVVGGNDIGPRTWVEQALPRLGRPPLIAVSPTVLLPELLPYVQSGQIDALVGTAADSAAYARANAGSDAGQPVDSLALLVGLLAALGVPAQAVVSRAWPGLRVRRRGEPA